MLLTLSQTSHSIYVPVVQDFWKTLQEKEKLLVTRKFSFSHRVFCLLQELFSISINFEIVLCKLFQFGSLKFPVSQRVKSVKRNILSAKTLPLGKMTKFCTALN